MHTELNLDETPLVGYMNTLIQEAILRGASDIHFEPYETTYRIRMRRDGILTEVATPPIQLGPRLASRLKVMSHCDIAEKRIPQDGRFKMHLPPIVTSMFA